MFQWSANLIGSGQTGCRRGFKSGSKRGEAFSELHINKAKMF